MTAKCKKITARQLAGINRYLKKLDNKVNTKKSYYDSAIYLWNIELEELIDVPHHHIIMSKIAKIIMKEMEIEQVCLGGVVYHQYY